MNNRKWFKTTKLMDLRAIKEANDCRLTDKSRYFANEVVFVDGGELEINCSPYPQLLSRCIYQRNVQIYSYELVDISHL